MPVKIILATVGGHNENAELVRRAFEPYSQAAESPSYEQLLAEPRGRVLFYSYFIIFLFEQRSTLPAIP